MVVQVFYMLTLILPLVTILIFGMKYWSAAVQSREAKSGEEAYRALSEKAVAAQQDNVAVLSAIRADVAKLSGFPATVENVLKQIG